MNQSFVFKWVNFSLIVFTMLVCCIVIDIQDCQASGINERDGGYQVTSSLWTKAILQTPSGPVTLIWQEVGSDTTTSGDSSISGYFYADPNDFAYGSIYNPEVFVKIYIAKNGWANLAFNHVTVDDVTVFSSHQYNGNPDQTGVATLNNRLIEHQYTGVVFDSISKPQSLKTYPTGIALDGFDTVAHPFMSTYAINKDAGYTITSDLWARAVLNTASGAVTLIWKAVGTDTTASGAKVVSGYFYADPADFAYGSMYNPEVFVKIYIAANGWANIAFNHVTVDDVTVYSSHRYDGSPDKTAAATLAGRLQEHQYTGVDPTKDNDTNSPGDVEIPADEAAKISTYTEVASAYSDLLQDVMEDNFQLIQIASNGFTETIDAYEMSDSEMDQFDAQMDLMLPNLVSSILYSYDLSQLENSLSGDSIVSSPDAVVFDTGSNTELIQPKLLISGGLAIAGAALTIKGLYDYGFKSYKTKFKIAEDVINNTTPGSKEHRRINSELGLDEDTPVSETLRNFKQESFFKKNGLSKAIIQANSLEGDDTANGKRRTSIKNTANEGGAVAVKTTVGLATTVTGGQGMDKIAQAAGASKEAAGLIDLYISHKGGQPLDKFANSVTVTVQSKETKTVTVEKSEMSLSSAKKIMKNVAAGDLTGISDPEDLIDAFNAVLNTITKQIPGATINPDGSVGIDVPESIHIENRDSLKDGEAIVVPEMGDADIIFTAEGKKPELVENVDLTIIAEIILQAEEIAAETAEKITLTSKATAEDDTSITYLVTAQVSGVTGPITVSISVENASTSSSRKTLSADGSVSWSVTVLDKDGTVTVTRSDTKTNASISLSAKTATYDGTYIGHFTTTFEAEDAFCWDSGELEVSVSGPSLSGMATGTVTGNKVSGTGEYGMVFSGSINGNVMSGSWHDPAGDCSGTFSVTKQ